MVSLIEDDNFYSILSVYSIHEKQQPWVRVNHPHYQQLPIGINVIGYILVLLMYHEISQRQNPVHHGGWWIALVVSFALAWQVESSYFWTTWFIANIATCFSKCLSKFSLMLEIISKAITALNIIFN